METIRMGVVGLGGIAHIVHIPGIQGTKEGTLTAVCDIDREKLEKASQEYQIDKKYCFTSYTDMMDSGCIDAVSICTPNNLHVPVALAAMERNMAFACEKPISATLSDAERLLTAYEKNPIPAMVCFSYRYKAAARYARDLVQSGALGKIRHVYAQYFQAWGEKAPLIWRFVKSITGSGALGDLGCHILDLVRFITGLDFKSVTGQHGRFINERPLPDGKDMGISDVDDYANVMALLDGGIPATFQITRFAYGRGNYQRVEIYGEKGAIVYNLEDEDTLQMYQQGCKRKSEAFQEVSVPEKYKADQMQSFMDLILNKSDGLTASVYDGVYISRLMEKILESGESGKTIAL